MHISNKNVIKCANHKIKFLFFYFFFLGMLGTSHDFKRAYEHIILRGQNTDSTDAEKEKAVLKTNELIAVVNQCIIRRTNQILTKYLPVKFEMVICSRLTEIQLELYRNFVKSDKVKRSLLEGSSDAKGSLTALSDITTLKKICSHPELVNEKIQMKDKGFEKSASVIPEQYKSSK